MTAPPPPPAESTVDLKNRWLAAGLALLLPGLGHWYQRRNFKAAIYFFCILGLFFTGQALGEWKVVYLGDSASGGRFSAGGNQRLIGRLLQGYGAQFPVGVFAWPAMIQSRRYHAEAQSPPGLPEPLSTVYHADLLVETVNGPRLVERLSGVVTLEPVGRGVRGTFQGATQDGRPVEFPVNRLLDLGRRVSAGDERTLVIELDQLPAGLEFPEGVTQSSSSRLITNGVIPRSFWDRYQVPLGGKNEGRLTAKLGGRLEIAYVFTWIAGLLNVLAIWDALDGPAYGHGSEPELKRKSRRRWRREDDEADAAGHREPAGNTA